MKPQLIAGQLSTDLRYPNRQGQLIEALRRDTRITRLCVLSFQRAVIRRAPLGQAVAIRCQNRALPDKLISPLPSLSRSPFSLSNRHDLCSLTKSTTTRTISTSNLEFVIHRLRTTGLFAYFDAAQSQKHLSKNVIILISQAKCLNKLIKQNYLSPNVIIKFTKNNINYLLIFPLYFMTRAANFFLQAYHIFNNIAKTSYILYYIYIYSNYNSNIREEKVKS